ncbi:MAG: AAA family ATPase [Candidatus Aureabacteria bacterium]|nr:AAA family ATPase [Candidatus Auribacterota bacterium]
MNFQEPKQLSEMARKIEPYQYQIIEKKFSNLLSSINDDSDRDKAVLRIHSYLHEGLSEERIFSMFTGQSFPLPHCLAFASGKGGVGKSMLSVNTAVFFSKIGKRVLLFDADYGLSNAHIYLNFRTKKSLLDFFLSGDPEDAVEKISSRLDYIHTGSGELKLVDMDEYEFTRIRKMLMTIARRYDVIIMDCSPGIGKDVIQTLLVGTQSIMVTTPQVSSITDTYALIKVLCQARMHPRVNVVVNMARSVQEADQAFQRISLCTERFLKLPVEYLGNLFYSSKISQSLNERTPVIEMYPLDTRSGARIIQLAQNLFSRIKKDTQKEVQRDVFNR